jgi:hypothetical protein
MTFRGLVVADGQLIYMILKKSMLLSNRSRLKFNAGKINALISADASYAEMAYTEAGLIVMCPPVIIIGCALIIKTIGVAGLAGVGVSGPLRLGTIC